MMTLADMNPCGLSSISGPAGSGKTTLLRSLIEEVGIEPLFVIDLEQENWTDIRPDVTYLSDVFSLSDLMDLVQYALPGSIFFINGIQFLECPGTLLEGLADLWVIAKERNLRIIMTLQTRRSALGGNFKAVTEGGGPTIEGVTDGFFFNL